MGSIQYHQLAGSRHFFCLLDSAVFSRFVYTLIRTTQNSDIEFLIIILLKTEKGLKDRDVLVHGINVIMSLTDIFVSRRPCRMSHFFHSAGVIIPYFVFSLIYWAAGGRRENGLSYLYPVLNWDNLSVTMPCVTVGLVVGLPTVHGAMWALHWLRDRTISFTNQCKFNQQEVYGGQWDRTSSLQEDSTSSTTDSSTKTTLEKV